MKYYIQKSGKQEHEITFTKAIELIKRQGIREEVAITFMQENGCVAFKNFCIWSESGVREEWESYLEIIEKMEKGLTEMF